PPGLVRLLQGIHTGVRALLVSRPWSGCGNARATAGPRPLDPAGPIPAGITLFAVEGDDPGGRIPPAAPVRPPEPFECPPDGLSAPDGRPPYPRRKRRPRRQWRH